MIIFKSLHSKVGKIEDAIKAQGQFLEREARNSAIVSNFLEKEIFTLKAQVGGLLEKVFEYMKQNEELTKSLTRLAQMEADMVAKRITEADLPQPTEFDKRF